jgi:ubiquitin carboxyl-terminal hydrolase 5/13
VRYSDKDESHLFLPVNLEAAQNYAAYQQYMAALQQHDEANKAAGTKTPFPGEAVLPKLSMDQLLTALFSEEEVPDWMSPAANQRTTALKSFRMDTFPKYLVMAVNKFYLSETWTPKKKEISLQVPAELDLTPFKAAGLQPGEIVMPEEAAAPAAPAVVIDDGMVQQLASMGFAVEGCRCAVYNNPNSTS